MVSSDTACGGRCCGPRRLHPFFQVLGYIVFALMLLLTLWQGLQLVGGSLANCAEKPERCVIGTVQNANLRFVTATIPFFLFSSLLILPLIIFWRPERAFASAAIAAILLAFCILLLFISIFVFYANLPRKDILSSPGLSSFIAGTVILCIHLAATSAAWIRERVKPQAYESTLFINNL